jgi:hypothetical protein
LTPATLIGVSGCPIRASAVSIDKDGDFAVDQSSESGAAQKSAAAAIMPMTFHIFILLLLHHPPSGVGNRKEFFTASFDADQIAVPQFVQDENYDD